MLLHSQIQGPQTPAQQPRLHGTHNGTVQREAAVDLGNVFLVGHHRTADQIAVTAQILRGAVDHNIGAHAQWPGHGGGGEGIVYHELAAVGVGDPGNGGQVIHFHQGIADGLSVDHLGIGADSSLHLGWVIKLHKGDLHAKAGQFMLKIIIYAAI